MSKKTQSHPETPPTLFIPPVEDLPAPDPEPIAFKEDTEKPATHLDGATVRNDISKRQGDRKAIAKRVAEMPPPCVYDDDSIKEHAKKCRDLHSEYSQACSFVDYDIDRLKKALEIGAQEIIDLLHCHDDPKELQKCTDLWLAKADRLVPMSARDRADLEKKKAEEEQARQDAERLAEKNRKKDQDDNGDIPGQLKLKVKDDGSIAEAASECTTRTLEESEDE